MNSTRFAHEMMLAHTRFRGGRLAEAEGLYRQILATEPDNSEALHHLGLVAYQVGRHDVAIDLIRRALVLHPNNPSAHSDLGEVYRESGRYDEALASYEIAALIQPDFAVAHYNLGNALHHRGRLEEAIAAYRRTLQIQPELPEAWHNLGIALARSNQPEEAVAAYQRALQLRPDMPDAWNNLGIALAAWGRTDDAIAAYQRVIQLRSTHLDAFLNLGHALKSRGHFDEAAAAYRRAVELRPNSPKAHNHLGIVLLRQGRVDEALAEYRRALELRPDYPDAWNNLGIALGEQGRSEEATDAYRRSLQLKPDQASVHSNLIYTLHSHLSQSAQLIAEEWRRWNEQFCDPLKPFISPHPNDRDPGRRLRIGYVSPSFRSDSVSFFLAPLLEAHDHSRYEIYCYAGIRRADSITKRLRQCADVWRGVHVFTDTQLAECIRTDGIDILIDLSMHTAEHRLLTFARKPAPVQVSWLAYPGSTGLEAINYRLTDAHIDPLVPEDLTQGGRPVRLPDAWCCYAPIEEFPVVAPLPAAQSNFVTFGSLNQFSKINEDLLRCWAKLLKMVPTSRLLMCCPSGSARLHVRTFFATHGLAAERIELVPRLSWPEYVQLFRRIDVALDSFPCNGMTTTCHTLWMGVPVVTRTGTTAVSRAGHSLLHTLSLPEWVARSEDEYIRIAREWAQDLPRLAELRRTLRPRLQASPLMDAPRFARNMETAYRTMWQAWCTQQSSLP